MASKLNAKEDYDEGMWNVRGTTLRQGEECILSDKHMRSGSSRSKSAFFAQAPVDEYEGCCMFEEELPLPKMSSLPGSFLAPFEKKQCWREDPTSLYTEADCHRSKSSFEGFEKDTPNEFSSENLLFQQPFFSKQSCYTSSILKSVYGESLLGASDFEVHVQSSNSSKSFGDIESAFPAPELSAQESVTEEGGDRSKSQPSFPEKLIQVSTESKNTTPESRLPTQETTLKDYSGSYNVTNNGISKEVTAHPLKAGSDNNSDDELNFPTKELLGSTPVLCQQVKGKDADDDNLKGSEPKTMLNDPCYQLMTVERYVLRLFSVPNGKADVWNSVKLSDAYVHFRN